MGWYPPALGSTLVVYIAVWRAPPAQPTCPHAPGCPGTPSHLPALRTLGGVGDGSACEKVSASPSMTNPVPIVVMNEGTPSVTVMNPFTQPATTPASSPRMIAMNAGT